MAKDLKTLREEQVRVAEAMAPEEVDTGIVTDMEEETEPEETEGMEEEEYNLESYDLAALVAMGEDEMTDKDDDDDDGGNPFTEDESGESESECDDEEEEVEAEDYGDDEAPIVEDEDEEEESEMSEAGEWFERNVAAALVDAGLQDLPISSKVDATKSLRKASWTKGSAFIKAMTTDQFDRMQTSLVPVYKEAARVVAELRSSDSKAKKIAASLRRGGKKEVAAKMEEDLNEAREKDLADANLDYVAASWLEDLVTAHLEAPVKPATRKPKPRTPARKRAASAPKPSKNPVKAAFVATAQCASELVEAGKVKTAAKLLSGTTSNDACTAAKVLAGLWDSGKHSVAASMAADLRKASYINPDIKPVTIDPTQPAHQGVGQRAVGPLPDAGFSYGMDDSEVRKAMSSLDIDASGLKWVAEFPKTAKGGFDIEGNVKCFTTNPGDGASSSMTLAEAKDYIKSKMPRQAVLLADPFEFSKVGVDDITVILQASASEDPFYTILVHAMPVGEVHLQDQDDPENARSVFADVNIYGKGMREGMAKFGVGDTLQNLKARYFVSAYNSSDEMDGIRTLAAEEADKMVTAEVDRRTGGFLDLMMLAHEGIRRNAYSVDDPLKFAFFERLKEAGLREASINDVIEQSINMPLARPGEEGSERVAALTMYLELIAAKAIEFSEMEPSALKHISEQIIGAPVRYRQGSSEVVVEGVTSLKARLEASSQYVTNVGGPLGSRDPQSTSTADTRDVFRTTLGIGSRYRNKQG